MKKGRGEYIDCPQLLESMNTISTKVFLFDTESGAALKGCAAFCRSLPVVRVILVLDKKLSKLFIKNCMKRLSWLFATEGQHESRCLQNCKI